MVRNTHRCGAPFAGRIDNQFDALVVPPMNEYLEHHRECRTCAERLGLSADRTCVPADWCDVAPSRLCGRGRELLAAWCVAATVAVQRETGLTVAVGS